MKEDGYESLPLSRLDVLLVSNLMQDRHLVFVLTENDVVLAYAWPLEID